MNSMGMLTVLASENKNPQHEAHLYEFYNMCQQMILEMVPEIVEKVIAEKYINLLIKIKTTLNNREVDFPDVREYIYNMILEELESGLK